MQAGETARHIQAHLRSCGVVVHLATSVPREPGRPFGVVVFLEEVLAQHELARDCVVRLPGVLEVTFSTLSRAIMYVVVGPLGLVRSSAVSQTAPPVEAHVA
ncbi:hypothetical protein GCM10022223_03130 [Kineosporia mesophila]|uniref:Uncharacterized protein n=1 Tax=Kineosporia mesophila TaxID=566012 RepID=A0ABP6YW72_9ACTN|nr:hypothetical protein [Kineosporia mesophila]MCD5351798.1 hypothetical protein [Kineosporia mesophila]